jgi:hypothetical protein
MNNHGAKLLQIHRLGQVVKRTGLERLNGVFGRSISGNDHTALLALLGAQGLDDTHAQAVRQPHISNDHIEPPLCQVRQGLGHSFGRLDAVALAQKG